MYGIAGFMDGFMGGVDTAHKWKDRKRDQKRQDRLDAMDEEAHQRRMRIWDQQIAATDKSVADQAFMEGVYADSVEAAKGAMGVPGVSTSGPPPSAPGTTSGLPMPSMLPLGIPDMPSERPKVAPPGMPTPQELMEGAKNAPGVVNAPTVSSGPAFEQSGRSGPPVVARGIPATAPADPLTANGVKRLPDGSLVAPAPSAAIADELYGQGPAGVRYLGTEAEIAERTKRMAPPDPAIEAERAQAMELERLRRVRDEDGPIPEAWRKEADEGIGKITRERTAANPNPALDTATAPPTKAAADTIAAGTAKGGALPALSAAWQDATKPPARPISGQPTGKAPASAPPAVKEMADTASSAMAATTTPAMEAAAASASRGLPEVKPGTKPTEEKRGKYAKDFMDHYREVGAPMVYEALISKGEFEKAEAFRTFLERDETKAGMENWAKAAFAATVGDMDTFATEIMEAYDRLDYFPDGTTIVREESGFTRDKEGNITGAKLTFKDAKTGNTFDQVFTDPNDLVRMGITLLAPEQAFEYYFEEQAAQAEQARGIAKEQTEAEKAQQKRVDEVAKLIFENSKGIDGMPTLTYAQALQQAQEQLGGGAAAPAPAAAPGGPTLPPGPPVARRPQG